MPADRKLSAFVILSGTILRDVNSHKTVLMDCESSAPRTQAHDKRCISGGVRVNECVCLCVCVREGVEGVRE